MAAVAAALTLEARCTMKNQEAPPLSGPSGYATSIAISTAPDVLTQDGASQSLITITARDTNSAPIRNLSMRADITVGGVHADFGSLSARNLVTGSDGRASLVYTAPAAPSVSVDNGTIVEIVITPVGTDYANTTSRTASIRLVPPGSVAPPDGLKPNFTFTPIRAGGQPDGPVRRQQEHVGGWQPDRQLLVELRRRRSRLRRDGGPLVHDCRILRRHADHLRRFRAQRPEVGQHRGPRRCEPDGGVHVVAQRSAGQSGGELQRLGTRAAPGHTIKSYEWDFGDGVFGSGITTTHTYGLARSYVVVLTVTDESGKKGTATGTVAVK